MSKIYEWFLKLCECLLWVILNTLCQALVSEMNFTDNFWMIAYFYNRYNDSKTGKMFYLVQKKKMFWVHLTIFANVYIKKNSKAVFKPRKNADFLCLLFYLKETEPGLCPRCLQTFVLFGKGWKYGKEKFGMETYFSQSSSFPQVSGIIHRGKIRV